MKRQAAVTGENDPGPGGLEAGLFDCPGRGAEHEFGRIGVRAVEYTDLGVTVCEAEVMRQSLHPGDGGLAELRLRIGVPFPGEQIAAGTFVKVATAILLAVAQLHFHVAGDGVDAPLPDAMHAFFRLRAVADDVAGTNNVTGRNVQLAGYFDQSFQGRQVAVHAAKHQHLPAEYPQVFCTRFPARILITIQTNC